MGWRLPPLYGKDNKREEKKIAKINTKIKKLEAEKTIYTERIEKRAKKEESVKVEG